MFEVIPEPEFSAWFETLPDPFAEEVAAVVDLTASVALSPERLSRSLLWYDGTGNGSRPLLDLAGRPLELRETPALRLRDYLGWQQEVVLCLESASFRERLIQLDAARSESALALVELLKRRLHAARLGTTLNPWHPAPVFQAARHGEWAGVREAFDELLKTMGLASQHVLGSGSGLRELTLSNMQPSLRILFGLDFPGKRLIAILGEALDRSYYGESVRRAERRWQDYLTNQARNLEQRRP
jgi:hypothetical protein